MAAFPELQFIGVGLAGGITNCGGSSFGGGSVGGGGFDGRSLSGCCCGGTGHDGRRFRGCRVRKAQVDESTVHTIHDIPRHGFGSGVSGASGSMGQHSGAVGTPFMIRHVVPHLPHSLPQVEEWRSLKVRNVHHGTQK